MTRRADPLSEISPGAFERLRRNALCFRSLNSHAPPRRRIARKASLGETIGRDTIALELPTLNDAIADAEQARTDIMLEDALDELWLEIMDQSRKGRCDGPCSLAIARAPARLGTRESQPSSQRSRTRQITEKLKKEWRLDEDYEAVKLTGRRVGTVELLQRVIAFALSYLQPHSKCVDR